MIMYSQEIRQLTETDQTCLILGGDTVDSLMKTWLNKILVVAPPPKVIISPLKWSLLQQLKIQAIKHHQSKISRGCCWEIQRRRVVNGVCVRLISTGWRHRSQQLVCRWPAWWDLQDVSFTNACPPPSSNAKKNNIWRALFNSPSRIMPQSNNAHRTNISGQNVPQSIPTKRKTWIEPVQTHDCKDDTLYRLLRSKATILLPLV